MVQNINFFLDHNEWPKYYIVYKVSIISIRPACFFFCVPWYYEIRYSVFALNRNDENFSVMLIKKQCENNKKKTLWFALFTLHFCWPISVGYPYVRFQVKLKSISFNVQKSWTVKLFSGPENKIVHTSILYKYFLTQYNIEIFKHAFNFW